MAVCSEVPVTGIVMTRGKGLVEGLYLCQIGGMGLAANAIVVQTGQQAGRNQQSS